MNRKIFRTTLYAVIFSVFCFLFYYIAQITSVKEFIVAVENKTFDLRQSIIQPYKEANKDIVILAIDDASYEYLIERYGEWPISRAVYGDLIHYVQKYNPKVLAFDLMFVKSFKNDINADKYLASSIAKYDNVFTSINFDSYDETVRKPPVLPDGMKVNVQGGDVILNNLNFINCRAIISDILNSTSNVGVINLVRQEDGIARKVPVFVGYQNEFYPHLALIVTQKYLGSSQRDFLVNRYNEVILVTNRFIPLDYDGGVILNWYGQTKRPGTEGTYEHIPFYKVIEAMNNPQKYHEFAKKSFENKIVYVGTTATSLHDIKSVPVDRLYPGVELHATYVNNIIDNNFIKRTPPEADILVSLGLIALIAYVVLRTNAAIISSSMSVLIVILYLILTTVLMHYSNLWCGWIAPVLCAIGAFIISYIIKYIMKSRDFEQTYKLATTDGLTDLYNHRYFQEQMIVNMNNSNRYNGKFSIVLMDIDHFKKFNDTYGHQAGDAVLRQVAQILKKSVRSSDIVCRYGGEEMVIILTNTQKPEAITTAEKICKAVAAKPFKLGDKEVSVTISIGVATYPDNAPNVADMIEYADKCLYKAKEGGRNRVEFEP